MSSNFSNLVKPNPPQGLLGSSSSQGFDFINPKNSALFSIARGIKNIVSPQQANAQTNVNVGASDPARNPQITPVKPINNAVATNPTPTSNVSTNTNSTQPDYKTLLEQSMKGQLGTLQSQLAEKQQQDTNNPPQTTAGISNDAFGNTLQGKLIKQAIDKQQQASEFTRAVGQKESDVQHDPNYSIDTGVGLAGQIAQNQGLKAQSLTTQAGQLGQLAGQVAPQANAGFFTDPSSGQFVGGNGQGGGQLMNTALQNAINMVKSGNTNIDDAIKYSGLSAFGVLGQSALTNALNQQGGGYSPTTVNTQVGTNQKLGSDFQSAAAGLSTSLQQFGNVSQIAQNFLQSNPEINPTQNPMLNDKISTYIGQLKNPAAKGQYDVIMNDADALRSAVLQGISSGGLTPTASTNQTLSTDPRTLSPTQLVSWLNTVTQLGESNLGVLQKNSTNAYGGSSGFVGNQANTNLNTTTTPNATTAGINASTLGQAAGGAGIQAVGGLEGAIKNIGGQILGIIEKSLME